MPEEIDIRLHNEWNFNFDILDQDLDQDFWDVERKQCCYCKVHVDKAYSYIIDCLKKANLLDENYKQICCYCKVLEIFGLLDLYKNMGTLIYDEEDDILILEFVFSELTGGTANNKQVFYHVLYFNIHDYSKVKWG